MVVVFCMAAIPAELLYFMMTEKTWEEILAEAQPMEVKKIVNNAPSLPKIKFYEEVEDNESKD